MSDIQTVFTFLQKYGVEIIAIGVLVCLLTSLIKKITPKSIKNFIGLMPFILGVLLYALYSIFLSGVTFYDVFNKGIQTGAVATLIYAFSKQIKVSGSDIKKCVSELLSGILSSKTISEVVKVIKKHCTSNLTEEEQLSKINEILSGYKDIPEDVKDVLAKLVLKTLYQNKKREGGE